MKPLGEDAEHPGYASLLRGQQHVADLVRQVQASPYWKDTAIVITYDDHGGRWDHVVSILRFIEKRWNLRPLGSRDAAAADLTAAFDFGS